MESTGAWKRVWKTYIGLRSFRSWCRSGSQDHGGQGEDGAEVHLDGSWLR